MDKEKKRLIELLIGGMFIILLLIFILSLTSYGNSSFEKNKKISYERTFVQGKLGETSFGIQNSRYVLRDGENYFEKNFQEEFLYSNGDYFYSKRDFLSRSNENLNSLKIRIN